MKKRVISTLLAAMMAIGLFTGCGNKESAGSKDGSSKAEESKAPAESGGTESGETVTITWCIPGDKQEDHDKVMEDVNKKIKEKINVELNLDIIPQGEFNDKMKLKSTGGEEYDLTFTANWLNSFDENMSRDAFLPLNDLLDAYGSDIKAAMPEWLLKTAEVKGEIYAVPNQQITAKQYGVVVQKEYAKKYNLDMTSMKSIRDIEPFLDEIVANEPDLYPIDKRVDAYLFAEYETIANGLVCVDKKTGNIYSLDEVIADQLKLDNEWYQKGYIQKDIATVTDNSADVKANRYVVSLSTYKPGWDAEYTNRQGVEYISIPIEGTYVGVTSGIETMTAVNVNSKHPEEAIKLLNLIFADKEIYNELLYGLEGTHYNVVSENHVEVAANSKYNLSSYGWKMGNQFNAWYMPGQEDGLWEATDKLNKEADVSPLRGFTFSQENVQAELAQLAAVVAEFKNGQFDTSNIDQFITDYKNKLNQAGIQTVKEEVLRQVNEWKASK